MYCRQANSIGGRPNRFGVLSRAKVGDYSATFAIESKLRHPPSINTCTRTAGQWFEKHVVPSWRDRACMTSGTVWLRYWHERSKGYLTEAANVAPTSALSQHEGVGQVCRADQGPRGRRTKNETIRVVEQPNQKILDGL